MLEFVVIASPYLLCLITVDVKSLVIGHMNIVRLLFLKHVPAFPNLINARQSQSCQDNRWISNNHQMCELFYNFKPK